MLQLNMRPVLIYVLRCPRLLSSELVRSSQHSQAECHPSQPSLLESGADTDLFSGISSNIGISDGEN